MQLPKDFRMFWVVARELLYSFSDIKNNVGGCQGIALHFQKMLECLGWLPGQCYAVFKDSC